MKEMTWCRCCKCGHKLFLYSTENAGTKINIKCSSCKRIIDITFLNGEAKVNENKA